MSKPWRRIGIATLLCIALPAGACRADSADEQFNFANGLYKQKLWELAAEKLRSFLTANPDNPQAKYAAYELGDALYRATNEKGDIDYAASASAYEVALAKYPDPKLAPQAYFELGDSYFNLKKYDKSAAEQAAFLKTHPPAPQAAQAQYWIGESYYALNQAEPARAAYLKVLSDYPASDVAPYAQYSLGLLAADAGQNGAAAAAFKAVLDNYPKSDVAAESELRRADALLSAKQYGDALAAYQTTAGDPRAAQWKADALLGIADASFGAGKWADAAEAYAPAIAALKNDDPNLPSIKLRQGNAYYNAKEYEKALTVYGGLTGADEKIAPAALYWSGGSLRALGRYSDAEAAYQKLLTNYPHDGLASKAAVRLGDTYADAKDTARAAEAYRVVLTQYKGSESANEAQAALVALAGDVGGHSGADNGGEAAVESVVRELPAGAATSNAELKLARAAFNDKDWKKAEELAQAALNGKPDAASAEGALYVLGLARLNAGDDSGAASAFRHQLADYPKGASAPQGRLGLAWALLDAKQWPDAVTAARAAVASPPEGEGAQASLALGEALWRAGNATEAAALLGQLVPNAPADMKVRVTYLYAESLQTAKQFAPAAAQWGALAEASPQAADKARAALNQGLALEQGKDEAGALAAFDRAIAFDPKSDTAARALYDSAWAAHDLKTDEGARWTRLTQEFPDSQFAPEAWYEVGSAQYQAKQWPAAAAAFDKAASFPKSDLALESSFWAGDSWSRAGNDVEARSRFAAFAQGMGELPAGDAKAAKLKEYLPAARLGIGRALLAAGDDAGAAAVLEEGSNGAKGAVAAEIDFHLGELLAKGNKWKDAAEKYLEVVINFGGSEWAPRAQWGAAQALEKSGDKQAAIANYQQLAQRQPADDLTARAQQKLKELQGT